MFISDSGESAVKESFRSMMGPMMVDHLIREAIQHCWMIMPEGKKEANAVEAEIRRLVERAIKDMKEDAQRFGVTE